MSRKNVEDIYPLSPLQSGLLFHTLLAAEPGVYFVQHGWTFTGAFDVAAFLRAFQDVVDRHPILRTAFVWDRRDRPMQVVREKVKLPCEHFDLRDLPADAQPGRVEEILAADRARGFELTRAPLTRVLVLRLRDDAWRVVWSSHHLLLDGWSTPLVTRELFALYEAHTRGEALRLPRPRPYGDYIGWLQKEDPARAHAFFGKMLRGFRAPTPLGVDRPAAPGAAATGEDFAADRRGELSDEDSDALSAFARQHHLTPSTVVLGAWALLLSRYAGEEDVLFGATVSGRSAPLPGIENMVGLFINTLPVRVQVDPEQTVAAFLGALNAQQAETRDFEHLPLVELQGLSDVPRGTPLFESLFVFENFPFDPAQQPAEAGVTIRRERTVERTNYPLTVVAAFRGRLFLRLAYDRRRLDDAAVERLLGHLQNLVRAMTRAPQGRLHELSPLGEAERHQLLHAWNDTAADYPRDACVHHLVERAADASPDAVAVVAGAATLTYRELEARANRLARHLRQLGVGPDVLVGLCARRSPEMVVGLLAVLKAGGAYVPLDPEYPRDRLAYMLADAGAPVLLVESALAETLAGAAGAARLVLLDVPSAAIDAEPATRLEGGAAATNLAYVIYTSGSTGRPKGAMLEHRGVVNYLTFAASAYRIAAGRGAPVHSSIGFDLTVTSLFGPLVTGRTVTLVAEGKGIEALAAALRDGGGYSLVKITPAHLEALPHELPPGAAAGLASAFIIGGEALTGAAIAFFQQHAPDTRLINEYGPTETVVGCSIHEVPRGVAVTGAVPIGRPIANTQLHVLDAHRSLVPVGVAGELYIGGDQVGRGYLNQPELTAERFVPDPFRGAGHLYRTGDRVRRLASGELEYLGRLDHQVKLRGYRIELGEIEAVLAQHAGVGEVAVLAREDVPGDKRLVAYVVAAGALQAGDLAAFARDRLPAYMVPSAFVALPALPLTANGKVDRRALPAPDAGLAVERVVVAPRGPVEEAIAAIFAEVLRVDPALVGAHDGFFALGGHSLLATAAIGRIRAALAVDLPLRALFDAPAPAELAAVIQSLRSKDAPAVVPPLVAAPVGEAPVLSFAQERLWFLAQLDPDDPSYNIPLSLRLEGRLDVPALARALTDVVRRHEVLRTTIDAVDGRPVPVAHEAAEITLAVRPVDEAGARVAAAAEAQRPFDLAAELPFRATLLGLGPEVHQLLFTMHHLVSDGWSQGVLYRELGALYAAHAGDASRAAPRLAEPALQYRDYAAWQRGWLRGATYDRELAFWRERLAGAPLALDLPADRPRPPVPSHRGARHVLTLDADTVKAVKDFSRREGATPFMTLLAAFDALLHRVTGQTDLLVGTPIAGRTRTETEGLLGFFVNTLVLRAQLSPRLVFRDLVARVKEDALGAFAHQDMPFEQLVRELLPERDPSRAPLFQVSFTLQAEPTAPPALPGLAVRRAAAENTSAKFDLTLALFEGPAGLTAMFEYATDLFDAASVARLAGHFETLLAGAVRAPEKPLAELPLLSAEERARVVETWNATAAPWPEDATLHELFEAHADRDPAAAALIFEGRTTTYGELEARANQVAHHLGALGVGVGSLVGISMRRAPEMIVALLGTLKAGAAWVPLDPTYPRDRLAFMMADAGVVVLLTQEAVADALPAHGAAVVALDALPAHGAAVAAHPITRPAVAVAADDAAYVIYTSGSTGRPKGVVVEHHGLGNVAAVHRQVFGVGPGTRVLQFSSMNFDASVWETVMALLNGATLVLAPQETLLPGPELTRTLVENRVNVLTVPPSVLAALPPAALPDLRTIVVAGEACPVDLVDTWAPGRRFWNAYGPTETSICATMGECFAGGGKPTIGKPIANAQVYILDAQLSPLPVGVPGELCIGGVGLARGYHERPDLTAEKFVQSPFAAGRRLYRTGDLARWLPDGNLEFIGRIDLQVKLRGFRIELGEIDAVLRRHAGVADAVTLLREDQGDPRLVAYFVASAEPGPSDAELRAFVEETLPQHMVPAVLVRLPALPLTPSGKIDRRALPAPEREARVHVAPRGPVEEAIAGIFAEVLRVPEVSAHDGFFELGGHSLVATQAVARIRAAFGVEVPLRALFEEPTPAGLAAVVQAALAAERGLIAPPLQRGARGGELPLSFGQERLWFLAQLEPDDPSYVIPSAARLRGRLDAGALTRALGEIVRRHEALRTTFASRGGRPVQLVHPPAPFDLPVTDLGAIPGPERLDAARRAAAAEARAPFDLSKGPLFRARLLRLGEDDHALVLTVHHIVSDGWSQAVLNRELGALYEAYVAGRATPLADLAIQYADYAAWQRAWLSGDVFDRQIDYWKETLGGAPASLDLPGDRPRPPSPSHRGARRSFAFPAEIGRAMEALARREGATLFMTLLAAFEVLLARLTGQSDIVVGTPVAGRARAETEGLVGFFINNLVLRTEVAADLSFRALVRRVRAVCLGAYAHQDVPFERLVQELAPERDLSRSPLFQVMFTLQNEPRDPLALAGLAVERLRADAPSAKIDLSVAMGAGPGALGGMIEYATDLFDAATIDRLVAHLGTLLAAIARDPEARVGALAILPEDERRLVVETWNATAAPYPAGATIHGLFEAQAARAPDAVALICEGRETTYRDLDERSNRLAHRLRRLGVGTESLVGVSMRRAPEMIVALLGTLKAGGAWVPLDPAYPRDRLEFMVADAGVGVLLTQDAVAGGLPAHDATVLRLDTDWAAIATESGVRPEAGGTAEGAAYVIYTSGSTGRPKGVVVTHRGLGNVAAVHHQAYGVGPGTRVLQFSSINFDASVWDLVMALLNGATLVLAAQDALLPGPALTRTLVESRVNVMTVPPSVLAALPHAELPDLRTIVVAGEACPVDLVDTWAPGRRFWNAYGPTETSICATMGECFAGGGKPTIGKPIANARVYVVDPGGQPLPIGVPGELCVGGVGLARGYLHRPELTAEKFVESGLDPAGRLYRTGDLCRWLADGTLEFIGRIDLQVKLRGFRIELGEIDAVLRQHPGVVDAVTALRADHGDPRLVAYFVAAGEPGLTAADLRAHLEERLPAHMVPAAFVALARMPLTPNGKVDRRALPAPEIEARAFVAPRGPVEEAIAGIFAEVLKVPEISAHTGFFELGGHSLLAAQVTARVRDALGVELPLRALFEDDTPAGLAAAVQALAAGGRGVAPPPLTRAPAGGPASLSFAQERLWFLDQLEGGSAAYMVPLSIRLAGPLDVEALRRALGEIVRRHEVLRTTFATRDDRPVAVVHPAGEFPLPITALPGVPEAERDAAVRRLAAEDASRPIRLAVGPVFRARLLSFGAEDHALSITLHHVVADAWALGVLNRELGALYDAFAAGRPSPLPELAVQYTDFAAWQRSWLTGAVLDAQIAFWKETLGGAPAALDLPTDRPRPPVTTHGGAFRQRTLPAALLARIHELSRREGATLFMTLLAAFDLLLARYSGHDDIVVGTPVAGRGHAETEPMIGFFINTLVLRARVSEDEPFVALLRRVKEGCLDAYAHQDTPFERLVAELDPVRDPSRSPLFQALFSLQNAPRAPLSLGGLVARGVGTDATSSKYDLTLAIGESERGLHCTIEYRTDLWEAATIDRMLGHYEVLLGSVAAHPDAPAAELAILDAEERDRLLVTWNDTAAEVPAACVHELFAAQASRTPDAVAVVAGDVRVTYGELEARSNQLAAYLQALGVGPDILVGLALHRTPDLVVGILGILKAGGAYVPLDPSYPVERLAFMLEDSAAHVVLTQESIGDELPALGMMVRLDADWPVIAAGSTEPLPPSAGPDNLAYVIYTSGSTGKPKGVLVEHRGLTNYLTWAVRAYDAASGRGAPVHSSVSFDLTVTGLFAPLLSGTTVELVPEDREIDALAAALAGGGFSLVKITPAHLEVLNQLVPAEKAAGATRAFVIGGEALSWEAIAFWREHAPATRLINEYGPTETVVGCSIFDAATAAARPGTASVPIGRPIANTRLYVLDRRGRPAPIGVPGELYIGGAGVARGYLNRPELTAERFVDDHLGGSGKLYRTGDLCRWLASGDLDFLGRIDQQVKIRGFRIELGEIESVLAQHPGVAEVAVLAREDVPGDKRLVAYLVVSEEPAPSPAELRAFLGERLPEYMVPAVYVALDALPLTPNGKVDRKGLPAPEARAADGALIGPRDAIEEVVAGIWAEILGMSAVSVHADFFELGGHSLLATQVMGRIVTALGVELPLAAIFEAPTVAGLAERVSAALAEGHGVTAPPIVKVAATEALAVSFAQERLWFLDKLEPGDPSYLVPAALRLRGPLDAGALRRALTEIVRRHEVLRTSFGFVDGRPLGRVHDPLAVEVPLTRWPALPPAEREDAARREIAAEARRPFDLAAAPLLRTRLFELGEGDHVLSIVMHHIVSDAWTEGVFYRELGRLYEAFVAGRPSPLPELAVQYGDFAAWQRGWLTGDVFARRLAYWKQALAGAPAALDLPTDRPRPPLPSHAGGRRTTTFPAELLAALKELSRREGVTLFMTLLAGFDVLLHRVTGQTDVVIGSPIAGRTRTETEPLLGFFINTLVLRARLDEAMTFRELLGRVRADCLGAYAHQDMPFERLVQELAPERDLSRTPLFQVMFALQNAGGGGVSLPGLEVRGFGADTESSKFELTLVMGESRGGLVASMEYAAELFDAATVERLLGQLERVLAAAVARPDARLWELPLLSPAEEQRLVVGWNEPAADFPPRLTVTDLFEAQVERSPAAPAVTFEGNTLTYRELDERSNRVAHALLRRGAGGGAAGLVGLAVERSLDTLVGILGILKAGAAYLPLDPDYPKDRLAFMIEDSRVAIVVTQSSVAEALPAHGAALLHLDADAAAIAAEPATRPARATTPASLAYVIYTSGSTGKPKGAMVTHHNVARLFAATDPWFGFGPSDVWTMFHSYAFDFSVWEIWGALLHGGRVVVVPYWVSRAPDAFYALLVAEGVTVLNQTPSAFRQLVHHEGGVPAASREKLRLRSIVFGGEALDLEDLRPWWERHPDTAPQLVNMYGITETTVHVTYRPVGRADLERPWSSVIGRPIPDLQLYILDAHRQPVPVGVTGEMYVGGAGVCAGYLSRPELTAERFLDDPYRPGQKLYRTGDLARHLEGGDVEYLGRIDHQVKIRGFRIELGEIEAVLGQHPTVREAVVLARQDGPGERRLVAYLVCQDGPPPTATELRAFVKQKLPDMMVPAAFVLLAALPLTENGKIDRRALPAPEEGERAALGGEFVAPVSAVEEALCRIWEGVLRLPQVGVHDNFFAVGGDSILSIQIVSRAQQAGIHLTPRQLFQHPTVAELAAVAGATLAAHAEQGPVTGPAPLTPIQRWWLEQELVDAHHWNQAFFLEVRDRLDPTALEEALAALLEHHDALRLRLSGTGAAARQTLAAPGERAPLRVVDLAVVPAAGLRAAIEPLAADAQRSLDLESGPVVRAVLFDLGATRPSLLLLVVHHLAVDGVSWRILLDDLRVAHDQRRRGEAIALPPKTTSFQHWGERLVAYARTAAVTVEAAYWLAEHRRRAAPMPVDHRDGDNSEQSARSVVVALTPEETEALLRKVPEAYQTQINDVLLTAFAQAWEAFTGASVTVLDLEGHGREELFDDVDLTRTVGWFTALYPLALELPGGGPGVTLKSIKEQVRAVPGRGVGYGLLRYLGDAGPALAALPQAEVSFNYLGQLDQALPGAADGAGAPAFRFAREPSGPSHSPRARRRYLLDVVASVASGKLSIQWTYSEACHRRATIESLASRYLEALRALIEHCLSPEAGGYTPSDFQEQGLSQNIIDMLAASDDDADEIE
jgi:amino acid adenylation domain-containing protein/non-ribosomal peptide synthase protein (TIGR01720 family)